MDFILDVIDRIKEFIFGHLKLFIILLIVLLLIMGGTTAFNYYKVAQANKYPITSIEAKCNKLYDSGTELQVNDVNVIAIHKNGGKTSLSTNEYTLSSKWVNKTGPQTVITVKLKENNNITCKLKVNVKREKILGFHCGYPNVKNVTAVLYSNGELCFEGKGDVLISDSGNYEWNRYEKSKDYPIKSVSFQKGVTPTNMNYWFKGCQTLEYVEPIPSSVITMVSTFEGCIALKSMPDLNKAVELLDMTKCFANCSSLANTTPIPNKVNNISYAFNKCIELLNGADISQATSVLNCSNTYEGCTKLSNVAIPHNATNLSSMFKDCINLKTLKEVPVSTESMANTFSGCTSLTTVGEIPESVTDMTSTFNNCQLLQYQIIINANPENYSNCFTNASVATSLNLAGNSKMLDVLANTNDNGNLKVFGHKPNSDLKSRTDVFPSN